MVKCTNRTWFSCHESSRSLECAFTIVTYDSSIAGHDGDRGVLPLNTRLRTSASNRSPEISGSTLRENRTNSWVCFDDDIQGQCLRDDASSSILNLKMNGLSLPFCHRRTTRGHSMSLSSRIRCNIVRIRCAIATAGQLLCSVGWREWPFWREAHLSNPPRTVKMDLSHGYRL